MLGREKGRMKEMNIKKHGNAALGERNNPIHWIEQKNPKKMLPQFENSLPKPCEGNPKEKCTIF